MDTKRKIYLDHAATTPVRPEVLQAMTPYFTEIFGNANSVHSFGRDAEAAVLNARATVARAIGCLPQEIYFTSGGTEADNWAIKGYCRKNSAKGKHIIVSAIEHAAIMSSAKAMEAEGFKVTFLPVTSEGIVDLETLKNSLRPDTILVSVMAANNEIGTIQPIKEVAELAHRSGAAFHTDAVQAIGSVDIDVKKLGIDMLTLSAHKFYGPKGIGALYVKKGIRLDNIITGGHQEQSKRGGTSNVPAIVGLGAAIDICIRDMAKNNAEISKVRDYFVSEIEREIPYLIFNGSRTSRLCGNANFSFRFVEGESILIALDNYGICASSGSACSSGSLEPSHVLLAIGLIHETAHGSVRFSFGAANTFADADYTVNALKTIIKRLRDMSPLYNESRTAEINTPGNITGV